MKQNFTLRIYLVGAADLPSPRKKEKLSASISSVIPHVKKIIFTSLVLSCLFLTNSFGQLAAWDFTGENTANATSTADIYVGGLDANNLLTRGSGALATAAANSFRTQSFQNDGISTSNSDFFQITLSASSGNVMSLSTIDARFAGTLSFANVPPGVANQFAYSLDGTNFTLISSPQLFTTATATLAQINLSGIPALQNVPATTTVTFRYYASGQTTTGAWGFTSPSAGSYGLAIGGNILAIGKTSNSNGAWTDPNIWTPSGVPSTTDNVVIGHEITSAALTRSTGTVTIINGSGRLRMSDQYTSTGANTSVLGIFQLDAGGFTTGGTFSYGPSGTLNFNNPTGYGVNNTDAYWPIVNGPVNVNILSGGITLNSTSRTVSGIFTTSSGVSRTSTASVLTLSGTTQINAGGFFNFSPTYSGSSSSLVYNTGVGFGTTQEWTGGASANPFVGLGTPGNVIIQTNGTNISLAGGRGTPGNITINNNAILTLNSTSGDLFIGGNLALNGGSGGLINNNRAVQFVQNSGTQTITAAGGNIFFDYLLISKPAGTVQLNGTDVTINTTAGDVLQLLNNGSLDLNGRALNLNNDGGSLFSNGARIIGSTVAGASVNINGNKSINYATPAAHSLTFESNITVRINPNNDFSFGSGSGIVNGILEINFNSFISLAGAPLYGVGSILKYNSSLNYNRSIEWTSNVLGAKGCPYNVQISNNTQFNLGANAGTNTPWLIGGNLVVDGGAGFYLDFGTDDMNQPLTVAGNLTVTGNLSLSNNPFGDIKVGGNIQFNTGYNFNANQRAVFFTRNGTQTISAATTPNFHLLVFQPVSGASRVELNGTDLNITAPAGGNVISYSPSNTDVLALNGRTLTLGTATVANAIFGTGFIEGSISSSLTLLGTGDIGTIRFSGSTPTLNNFTINRTASATAATLGSSLQVNSAFTLSNGILQLGNNNLTLSSAVASSGSANAFVVTNGTGSLRKNWTAPGSFTFHVGDATDDIEYSPATLQFIGGVFGANNFAGVRVLDAAHPNIPVTADNYITRYWAVSSSAIDGTTLDYNFTGTYLPADIMGPITTDALSGRWDGTIWTDGAPLTANTVSVTGLTTLPATNDFTGAKITGKNHFFRSFITGNWNNKASWESSKDGSNNWVAATNYPGTAAGGINIRNTHTITLTAEEKARLLTVETGGTLTNTNLGGGYVLSIADDGTAANDFTINGTYELFGTGPAFATGATAIVNTNGLVRANGNLNNESDLFARSNNVSFQTASIFEWNTTDVFAFGGVTYFPTANASTIPVFRLRQTPLTSIGVGGIATINGVFQVNSNITFVGGSAKNFRNGITGNAILTQNSTSGNSFNITGPTGILGGAGLRIVLSSPLNLTGAITVPIDSSVTISGGNIINNTAGNVFTINGTLDLTDRSITNTDRTVIINGTFRTANTGGFTGSGAIPAGTVNLNNSTSTVEYYADANQVVTSRPDYFNVILSGSLTKTPTSGFDPDGTITIKDAAIFDCTNYNMGDAGTSLTMTGGRLIVGTGGTQPRMGGSYNLTGGTIEFTGNSSISIRTQTYQNIEVTGDNVGNSLGNISLRTNGNFVIRENGVFEINADAIVGLGTNESVTVDLGGTFRTGDPDGFSGASGTSISTTIDNVTLNPLSNVVYSRSGNQTITNTHTYQNLELSGTGIKTPPLGATLTIQGNLTKSGTSTFNPNNGLVLLNGSGSQNFAGLPYSRLQLLNGTKTTVGSASIDSLLKIDASTTLNVSSGDSIVILSSATRTASVGNMEGTINYLGTGLTVGKFVIQRYLLSGRKWRLLSIPTNNINQTVRNSWLENGVDNTGFGFRALDTRNNWASLGYDGLGNNSSIKKYNPASDSWDAVDNLNVLPLQTERGYIAFVPGDRNVVFPATGNTILRTRGQLVTGTVGPIIVPDGEFAVIGNPYASRIDIRNINFTGTGIDQTIYVWDPSLTSFYGLGAFNQLFFDGTNYKNQFPSAVYGPFNSTNNFIESGQAFIVRATGLSSITFDEQDKVLGSNLSNFIPGDPQQLRVHLNIAPNGGSPVLVDGVMTQFDDSYSKAVDYLDIKKINPFGESVSWNVSDSLIVIERRASITSVDTLHLRLGNLRNQTYQWEVIGENLDFPGREGYLIDRFLNRTSPLNMAGATTIQFNIQSNPASYAADRFYIVFRQPAAGPLPVTFTTVTASRNADKTIGVQWKVEQEINITQYEVERSSNGSLFTAIHNTNATMNNRGAATYNYADISPFAADNFYRIKATSIDGQVQYSEIVKVAGIKAQPMITAFPNPVLDQRLQLQFQQQPIGRYQLQLSNGTGQVVWNKNIQIQQSTQNLSLTLPAKLATGTYQLLIVGADAVKTNLTLYVQ